MIQIVEFLIYENGISGGEAFLPRARNFIYDSRDGELISWSWRGIGSWEGCLLAFRPYKFTQQKAGPKGWKGENKAARTHGRFMLAR
jgi:hypothetical protein